MMTGFDMAWATDLRSPVSFGGGGGGGSGSDRQERRDDFHRNRNAAARRRQAEIDAGLRRGLSTQERNNNLRNGALTAAATGVTGVGLPKSALDGGIVAGGGMIIDSFN